MQIVSLTIRQTDDKLLIRNIKSIVKYSKINGRLSNDLFNEQLMTYYKAKKDYQSSAVAKFNTFLTTYLKNARSNYIRDQINDDEIQTKQEYIGMIPDKHEVEKDYFKKQESNKILDIIDTLDEKGQYILKERIFGTRTLSEIGEVYNCSAENIRQIYNRRLRKVRKLLSVKNKEREFNVL